MNSIRALRPLIEKLRTALEEAWNEKDHPRDGEGKFASGFGGGDVFSKLMATFAPPAPKKEAPPPAPFVGDEGDDDDDVDWADDDDDDDYAWDGDDEDGDDAGEDDHVGNVAQALKRGRRRPKR